MIKSRLQEKDDRMMKGGAKEELSMLSHIVNMKVFYLTYPRDIWNALETKYNIDKQTDRFTALKYFVFIMTNGKYISK